MPCKLCIFVRPKTSASSKLIRCSFLHALASLLRPAPGEGPLLADYKEHHTDVSVHFDVDLVPGKLAALQAAAGGLETKFKLSSKISTGG
jgi:hypothetical protein